MRQRTFVHFGQPDYLTFAPITQDMDNSINKNADSTQFFETEEAYIASLDMPGVKFSEINIDLDETVVTITADRKNPFDKSGKLIKKYFQTLVVPKNIDSEKIQAHYENGVLSLSIPKASVLKTKKKIQVSNGEITKNWSDFLGYKKKETETIIN